MPLNSDNKEKTHPDLLVGMGLYKLAN